MSRKKPLRIATALAAIFCLLWMQLAVAAYACPAGSEGVGAAAAMQAAGSTEAAAAPCSHHDATQPGLCLAHCNPADLSLNHAQADAPPVLLVPLHPLASSVP